VEFATLSRVGDKTVFTVLDGAKVAAILAKVTCMVMWCCCDADPAGRGDPQS
jgi:hypothetical protein